MNNSNLVRVLTTSMENLPEEEARFCVDSQSCRNYFLSFPRGQGSLSSLLPLGISICHTMSKASHSFELSLSRKLTTNSYGHPDRARTSLSQYLLHYGTYIYVNITMILDI